jgi:hypothetical protein
VPGADAVAPAFLDDQQALWCARMFPDAGERARACPKHLSALDDRFAEDWQTERRAARAALPRRDLSGRDLRQADLSFAQMEGAVLQGAQMEGAVLSFANLQSADLSDVRTSLRSADFTGAKNLTQQAVNAAWGDSGTILPEKIARPDHWDSEVIEGWMDDPKYDAWIAAGAPPGKPRP